jgi:hypothetical protein
MASSQTPNGESERSDFRVVCLVKLFRTHTCHVTHTQREVKQEDLDCPRQGC